MSFLKKMTNVLYISYDGMTDPLGQSQVLPYIKGLTAFGYSFTIISAEKRERFLNNKNQISKDLKLNNIEWESIQYTKYPPIFSTLYDYWRIKQKASRIHRKRKFEIVHCRSYISSLIGLWMKKKYGVKFIFDMRGFWADERVDGKLWNLHNPAYKFVYQFFKEKEKQFLENADYTISLTYKAKNEILKWEHIKNNPVTIKVIPCCVDTNLFDPLKITSEQKDTLKYELNIQHNTFILSYLGSIGTWYMLDEMLDFFKKLKNHIPNSKFLFITHDEHKKILSLAIQKGILAEDILIRPASRNEVPIVLSISSYSLFFILPAYSKMSSSPTKQGEIMAMGIPVICNSGIGDTDQIVLKYKAGLIVHDFNYDKAIVEIGKNAEINNAELRKGAIDYFSLNNGVIKYKEVYQSICQ